VSEQLPLKSMRNLIIILIALIPILSGCKKEKEKDPYMQIREIAWNYLNDDVKSTVNVDWKKAPVTETTFNGVSAYSVTFNTSLDHLLGPITVYVSTSSKGVLGQDLRD
jgi:hypothetical protein